MSPDRKDPPRPPRSLRSAGDDGRSSSKPTSVWDVVGDGRGPLEEVEFPGRAFAVDGDDWWVQELGRTVSGRPEDRGAELILLGFRRGGAPGEEEGGPGSEAPDEDRAWEREAWLRGDSLEALSGLELAELLEKAGPFRPIPDEPRPFFGPRGQRSRSGGRRGRR